MVKHCCYGGCKSNSKRHDVKFIPFVKPTSNLQRCRRWVHLCGRDSKIFNYSKITKVTFKLTQLYNLQGVSTQTFIFHFALAGRNMQVSCGLKVIWES